MAKKAISAPKYKLIDQSTGEVKETTVIYRSPKPTSPFIDGFVFLSATAYKKLLPLQGNHIKVLFYLFSKLEKGNVIRTSLKEIAQALGKESSNIISMSIKALIDAKLIEKTNPYTFTMSPLIAWRGAAIEHKKTLEILAKKMAKEQEEHLFATPPRNLLIAQPSLPESITPKKENESHE